MFFDGLDHDPRDHMALVLTPKLAVELFLHLFRYAEANSRHGALSEYLALPAPCFDMNPRRAWWFSIDLVMRLRGSAYRP